MNTTAQRRPTTALGKGRTRARSELAAGARCDRCASTKDLTYGSIATHATTHKPNKHRTLLAITLDLCPITGHNMGMASTNNVSTEITPLQQARATALRALADHYEIDPTNDKTAANEDVSIALDDPQSIKRWCSVTVHGDYYYLKAEFDQAREAMLAAAENIDDLAYNEQPVAVINLDTGKQFTPYLRVTWNEQ